MTHFNPLVGARPITTAVIAWLLLSLAAAGALAQRSDGGPPPLSPGRGGQGMQAERPQLEFPAAEQPDSQRGGMYIDLQPPAEGQFILDKARVIDEATQEKIREICIDLLREKATPIIVVTIESMAAYGGAGLRIETFARLLFDQWGIGAPEINGQVWNTGMLLLVSVGDRKARIELGAHWKRDKDAQARQIMDELIIPRFREGDYAAGILAGVEGLSHIARDLALPSMPRPWWHYALIVGAVALAIFTVVSLIRRGASGWAWLFWGAVFAVVGYLLYQMVTNSGRSGGGYSGGSFGGGFSGGGGATGSW